MQATPLRRLHDVFWDDWKPVDLATLVFVQRDAHVLLIRKKRGLGAGKINGPGGRLEPGESPLDCAVREVEEELCVTPTGLEGRGEQRFHFVDGYSVHVHVYVAAGCTGEPRETDEAIPLWTPSAAVPYDEMWEDDRLWLPHVLDGGRADGRYLFDGDRMLDYELTLRPIAVALP